MRLALLQMRIDAASRAANLAAAIQMIDRACAADPSPDLVILPAGCDGTGYARPAGLTPAMTEAFGQSIAAKAREWGIYVGVGFARFVDGTCVSGAALYDPDGDAVVRCPPRPVAGGEASRPSCAVTTPFGRWHLALGAAPAEQVVEATPADTALIAVPASRADTADACAARQPADLAASTKAVVCVVLDAGDATGGTTRVVTPTGSVVAEAAGGDEAIILAEVSGPPP
jgi:predicted amidohydrolase